MRKIDRGLFVILLLCLLGFTGCEGNKKAAVMNNAQSAGEEEAVTEYMFVHLRFVDNIYMTLPPKWTYSTYEKLNAGDGMESHEWGFKVYMDGNDAGEIIVSGSYDSEDLTGEEGVDFITNTGLLGKRYIREFTDDNKEAVRKEDITLTIPGMDYAYYGISFTITQKMYQENKELLENFLLNVGVTAASLE